MTRGFITIATGKEEYYILAHNLLRSYRQFTGQALPFAILADRENRYTEDFDDVILFPDGASGSYLDKLRLAELAPYECTIFVDADCLAYGDLNLLFDCFQSADDFSCFGRVLPLEDKTGWFEYENLGKWKSQVSYVVGLHGGIYYLRKSPVSLQVMQTAQELVKDYASFGFKGKFSTPGDEPLVALAMALCKVRPIPFTPGAICCYWEHTNQMQLDLAQGVARTCDQPQTPVTLLHWGTRYTRELEYKREAELLSLLEQGGPDMVRQLSRCKRKYRRKIAWRQICRFAKRVRNKLLRMMGWKR